MKKQCSNINILDDSSSSNNDLLTLMMLSGGMGGQMGGQMNPLMLSLLLGDDVPKSKASYDKICASDPACAAEVAKIYNADGVSFFSNLAVLYQILLEAPFLQSFLVQSYRHRR